jgi:phosphohistidine phosphatase
MIYLIRHADAVSDGVDPLRPLSQRGRDQVARVCASLHRQGTFSPVEFWHSPLARARETAELLALGLGLTIPVLMKHGLGPDDDTTPIAAILDAETRNIAVVGHEPYLGVLASAMAKGPAPVGIFFPFAKASVLALEKAGGRWRSEWLVRSP